MYVSRAEVRALALFAFWLVVLISFCFFNLVLIVGVFEIGVVGVGIRAYGESFF